MKSATVALALTSALGVAAVPTAPQKSNAGAFKIPAMRNPTFIPNGPAQLMKARAKYGAPISQELREAAERVGKNLRSGIFRAQADNGTVTATPDEVEALWLCPVEIAGKTFNLDFDTGSSDLWVFAKKNGGGDDGGKRHHGIYAKRQGGGDVKHNYYDCKSPVAGESWSIRYGDGSSASGGVARDDVAIGGLTVSKQAVECATTISDSFVQSPGDGLVGLGYSSINTVKPHKQKTWVDNAIEQGVMKDAVFTADLRHGSGSSYTFGECASEGNEVTWIDIDSSSGWYQWNDKETSTPSIADTGTTLLLIDDKQTKEYYSKVDGAKFDEQNQGYTFSCDAKLPDWKGFVGNKPVTVPGELINFAPVDEAKSACYGGIQSNEGIDFNIFGDIFLKAVYACFKPTENKFGFAPRK